MVSPSSFENVKSKWVPEVRQYSETVPIVLVGTKLDMREDPEALRRLQEQEKNPITSENVNLFIDLVYIV